MQIVDGGGMDFLPRFPGAREALVFFIPREAVLIRGVSAPSSIVAIAGL